MRFSIGDTRGGNEISNNGAVNRICENNNNSTFLRDYLEGFIVSGADRRQVDRVIAESSAAKRLNFISK
jgi:hypothetical protein